MSSTKQALSAQWQPASPLAGDGATPDSVVDALYESLSFEPGHPPNWDRFRSLFLRGALIVPPPEKPNGVIDAMDVETYIARVTPNICAPEVIAVGMHEIDAARNVVEFGDLAHILSSTETIVGPETGEPISRGINSVQLARSGGRWWIVSFLWDTERPDNPLPPGYLP